MNDLFTAFSLSNIDNFKARRAITLAFNDGTSAIVYAEVLIYLVLSYLKELSHNKANLEKNDMYMVKTLKDVEVYVGISVDRAGLVYKGLEAKGLISVKKQGRDHRSCVKVDLEAVYNLVTEYSEKFEETKESYLEKKKEISERRRQQAVKYNQSIINLDELNRLSVANNLEEIKTLSEDPEILSLIYFFNYYYKAYTRKKYEWTFVGLNTLMVGWRDRANRKGSELALSKAIHKELTRQKGDAGARRPFELRVRESFNPDEIINFYNKDNYKGVIYDDVLQFDSDLKKQFDELMKQ